MDDYKCLECGQSDDPMIVFVGTFRRTDGSIERLPPGYHPYCDPCRERLGITDEMNPGRDLRAEARQVVLSAVGEARTAGKSPSGRDKGIGIIMRAIDPWIGGVDGFYRMLGRNVPDRPAEVYDGVSDAMGELDPATMTASQALSLITTTNMVRDKIPNWKGFVARTHQHFLTIMDADQARRNLVGFYP